MAQEVPVNTQNNGLSLCLTNTISTVLPLDSISVAKKVNN